MVDLDRHATECPRCGTPVNGPTCPNCELHVETADVVDCYGCGKTILEEEATEHQYQKPISAAWVTEYYCDNCS